MRTALTALTLALAALTSGCLVAAAGAAAAGTYVWMDGNIESVEEASLADVHAAALEVLDEMGIAVDEQRVDATAGMVRAKNAADKAIRIDLEPETDTRTKIRIRIGTMGDEELSQEILTSIRARL